MAVNYENGEEIENHESNTDSQCPKRSKDFTTTRARVARSFGGTPRRCCRTMVSAIFISFDALTGRLRVMLAADVDPSKTFQII